MIDNPPLWYNERFNGSHRHEIFYGKNRQKSIQDGLVVFLKPELHNLSDKGVHFNKDFDLELKKTAQKRWLNYYNKSIEDFIRRFGKNYL